jgi:RNA polymerase sigma-70 factor (ECF subfamily)
MADTPTTRPSLLLRLRHYHDAEAWQQFTALYGPLVFGFARKRGLQEADAVDLTQTVLHSIAKALPEFDYDPNKGLFRAWLFTVVRRQLRKFREKQACQPQGSGDTQTYARLAEQPTPDAGEEGVWDQEYRQQLFTRAAELVRGEFADAHWRAFWQTAVEGCSATDVAQALGMSVGAVYTAKSRVLDRIRKAIHKLEEEP